MCKTLRCFQEFPLPACLASFPLHPWSVLSSISCSTKHLAIVQHTQDDQLIPYQCSSGKPTSATSQGLFPTQVTMAALTAANTSVYSMPSASVAPPLGYARPPMSQALPMPYRSNWLQLQAAAHAHKPAQPSDPSRLATSQAPQESSWVEVKSEPADKQAAPPQSQGDLVLLGFERKKASAGRSIVNAMNAVYFRCHCYNGDASDSRAACK